LYRTQRRNKVNCLNNNADLFRYYVEKSTDMLWVTLMSRIKHTEITLKIMHFSVINMAEGDIDLMKIIRWHIR